MSVEVAGTEGPSLQERLRRKPLALAIASMGSAGLLAVGWLTQSPTPAPTARPIPVPSAPNLDVLRASQPVLFEGNGGQLPPDVVARAQRPGLTVDALADGIRFSLASKEGHKGRFDRLDPLPKVNAAVTMRLVDVASPGHLPALGQRVGARQLRYSEQASAPSTAALYGEVEWRQVYPGIDWILHGRRGALEYDFLVAPGAQPSEIRWVLTGADRVTIAPNGELVMLTGGEALIKAKPIAYQWRDGRRVDVDIRFEGRVGTLGETHIGFVLGAYDASRPLMIDPTVTYATTTGIGNTTSSAIATDASGNLFHFGTLQEPGQPTRAQLTKWVANGSELTLAFSVILGGQTAPSSAEGIVIDTDGGALLVGSTRALDFPACTLPPTCRPHAGGSDAYIAKVRTTGQLEFARLIGGSGDDFGFGITTRNNSTYVVGETAGGIVDPLPLGAYYGGIDAFVAKFGPSGTQATLTYLGGKQADRAFAVTASPGYLHVVGETASSDFPVTALGICGVRTRFAGATDGFVTRLQENLLFDGGAFIGGGGDDSVHAITWVSGGTNGSTLVFGGYLTESTLTSSRRIPFVNIGERSFDARALSPIPLRNVTGSVQTLASEPGGFFWAGGIANGQVDPPRDGSPIYVGGDDGFVARFDTSGKILYAAHFGGSARDSVESLATYGDGIWVSGITNSRDFRAIGRPIGAVSTAATTFFGRVRFGDTQPDPFSIARLYDVAPGSVVVSRPVNLTGFEDETTISVSANGWYQLGCRGDFFTRPGLIRPGISVCVQQRTPLALGAETVTTLTVGNQSADFVSTTSRVLSAGDDTDGDGIPNGIEARLGLNGLVRDNDVLAVSPLGSRLFVMQLYRDVEGREGDASGVDFWTDRLARNVESRVGLAERFCDTAPRAQAVRVVARLYLVAFGRLPDRAGIDGWVTQLDDRRKPTLTVANELAASSEFSSLYTPLDDERFIDRLYQNALGRPPDRAGRDYWTGELLRGVPRGAIVARFIEMPEFQARTAPHVEVLTRYYLFLRRVPEAEGLAFWALQADRRGALTAAILGGDEYRARFLPAR
jgi:hypothetical protein